VLPATQQSCGNQSIWAERERSGSGRSTEREKRGERTKSAARNPLHRKIIQRKKIKIDLRRYHETAVHINYFDVCYWCTKPLFIR